MNSDFLDSVLIGGREARDIVLVEYDPDWPKRFANEQQRIVTALGNRAKLVEHIGSTAVPGLAAKSIIDILVAVDDADDEATYASALEAAGYVLRVREPGHRMFRTASKDIHVHLWSAGDGEVERHLRFRDRLRENESDRRLYESVKRDLAARRWNDTNEYAEAKSGVIAEIMDRASSLYPAIEPYAEGTLDVGDGQSIYWESCGNRNGKPAVVFHGGPGSGCTPWLRRFFNPEVYRVILFDQRGCGRSRPLATDPTDNLLTNTTHHLIEDIEMLRQHLGVESWLVLGGSWGSTLGLAYAERYPEHVTEIILFAVATTGCHEVRWITRDVVDDGGHFSVGLEEQLVAATDSFAKNSLRDGQA